MNCTQCVCKMIDFEFYVIEDKCDSWCFHQVPCHPIQLSQYRQTASFPSMVVRFLMLLLLFSSVFRGTLLLPFCIYVNVVCRSVADGIPLS